ncbi:MAG: leucine--tRNA ligase [Melioribacteraceae bacterium]|nr:leucine--tRNA ligase [Melioribacteraceae bacterium]MCF8353697.1 leucine--tRNA ligase [Melioribacteraceae bacterium]MCF8396073.1 leucine--tRNA ligase [Melioribacteraceae bacterium]MCF8418613.1 leucine--tRNA ligase [Melioribacteraceae bacterium]
MKYPFAEVEKKWQSYWENNQVFKTDLADLEKKLYCLVMFIYPSGSKLHCGHWYNYGPTDSWARFKKLQGYNVFEPMGYDAFGLPAENYAIKTGIHPQDSTFTNIDDIRNQLKHMGCMYDWSAELMTCVPEYYKWNQWLFLQLYKRGLAYRKKAPVNWCPSCQTVLANEQVQQDGSCERCGTMVEHKNLTQWFFKITDYADELLDGLNKIDWPDKTKLMQTNWIGKSVGTEVKFRVEGHDETITVFTTRPDTLFGVTYAVLAPESELVEKLTTDEYKETVQKYVDSVKSLTEIERTSTVKEKTGVPTGAFAINPVNGEKVPIWVADYVLASYGTGSVMAVPGHDERDFEFAEKFGLPIRKVILEPGKNPEDKLEEAYTDAGTMINSGEFSGLNSDDGIEKVSDWLEEKSLGNRKTNFRLRDWLISRQRYWGTPIPVVYCDKCGEVPIPEDQLPVTLPYDVNIKSDGGSPLAKNEEFINTACPQCGGAAKRDADTMDTFVDSSWYYLRYLNPNFNDGMFDTKLANEWTPVDMYVGGAEHATMHLLYARFIHKFLRDIGMVNSDEPFAKLVHQGTITNQGAKMSKSKGNVVNPDSFINDYGSDVFRMYLMFMGPYELGGDWSDKGIVGVDRFVQRTYSLFKKYEGISKESESKDAYELSDLNENEKSVYRKVNHTLNKFSEEIEHFRFNTAVALLMELLNELNKNFEQCRIDLIVYSLERFSALLSPLAPHLGEECWGLIGREKSMYEDPVWFEIDTKALTVDNVTIAVQVNGKLRAKIDMPVDTPQDEVKSAVFNDDKVKSHTDGKTVVKEIYVPNKIYNIVVK